MSDFERYPKGESVARRCEGPRAAERLRRSLPTLSLPRAAKAARHE